MVGIKPWPVGTGAIMLGGDLQRVQVRGRTHPCRRTQGTPVRTPARPLLQSSRVLTFSPSPDRHRMGHGLRRCQSRLQTPHRQPGPSLSQRYPRSGKVHRRNDRRLALEPHQARPAAAHRHRSQGNRQLGRHLPRRRPSMVIIKLSPPALCSTLHGMKT